MTFKKINIFFIPFRASSFFFFLVTGLLFCQPFQATSSSSYYLKFVFSFVTLSSTDSGFILLFCGLCLELVLSSFSLSFLSSNTCIQVKSYQFSVVNLSHILSVSIFIVCNFSCDFLFNPKVIQKIALKASKYLGVSASIFFSCSLFLYILWGFLLLLKARLVHLDPGVQSMSFVHLKTLRLSVWLVHRHVF